jgi:tRNA pseudouridine38-40 synthase
MNRLLRETIRVTAIEEAGISFHARHSARAKTYEYRMWRGEVCPPFLCRYAYAIPFRLDERAMIEAAGRFAGTHDFRSLAARDEQEKPSTVRTIFSSQLERSGDSLIYRVRGSGFLYHMVRNIVGTLLDVGRGNLASADVERILAAKNRSAAGPTVPARGLFLVCVEYENVEHEELSAPLPDQRF